MSSFTSILITGANRGLGLEFVKQYAAIANVNLIFATCRNPEKADKLQAIAKSNPKVRVLQLNVADYNQHQALTETVRSVVKDNGLNLLINNAGVYVRGDLERTTPEGMMESFSVNTIAPLMLTKALLPLLKESSSQGHKTAIINITSKMGSIDDNTSGSHYMYRSSKTALNMVTKGLSVDLKTFKIICIAQHPGWVQTDMGGKNAPLTESQSISAMIQTIENADESVNGKMLNYDGKVIPW
ncbi:hypothetical protein B4U79_01861 [Dinothrombium tinctorium]|uniref:C-factor n=1 Tax=Dinothrombium tinctorium TaxID=1965070 RepID=A0A3S4QM33_9ACAR|nr:hypothetical protein B4U79_01861 [Dinothrombium tinctorium]